ncbi:MAG: lipopolysaccharide export system protein LptA [Alcanivorax sp.]|jgi:lipopolysaccharide export system protein LptA
MYRPTPKTPWSERRRSLLALATVAICVAVSPNAPALPEDREQPIRITADQALRDEKKGFTEYTGNVRLDQGSLSIEADKITVHHVTEEADKIVAEGKPAHMQQISEADKAPIHARADTIEYFKTEERVHLSKNAQVEQDGSIVTGDTIDYFIAEQLVRADSDLSQSDSRVEVVIPAQVANDQKGANGTTEGQ